MENIIVGGVLLIIIGLAIRHIYKAKKAGVKCIGCPATGCCSSHQHKASSKCDCKK